MELPVSSNARTLHPFIVMILHGRDSGLGEVKQHDITVHKLIMAAGRETEQVLIPLASSLPQVLLLLVRRIGDGVWFWEGVW